MPALLHISFYLHEIYHLNMTRRVRFPPQPVTAIIRPPHEHEYRVLCWLELHLEQCTACYLPLSRLKQCSLCSTGRHYASLAQSYMYIGKGHRLCSKGSDGRGATHLFIEGGSLFELTLELLCNLQYNGSTLPPSTPRGERQRGQSSNIKRNQRDGFGNGEEHTYRSSRICYRRCHYERGTGDMLWETVLNIRRWYHKL